MKMDYVIEAHDIKKKYKRFTLDIPELKIPRGFATALIGENGAGKTTLLNILAGILLQYHGKIRYFDQYTDKDREEIPDVKELIGYTASGSYFVAQWKLKEVEDISEALFQGFHRERFEQWCRDLAVGAGGWDPGQKVASLSDGNRMKLMIAGVLARDTKLLLMDEPASPLDPVMRDRLCEIIREYLAEGDGQRSVFFSTHNVADMENVTDYAIIMEQGRIVEQGFVEDLKEKYVLVKGDAADLGAVQDKLFTCSSNQYGFEGICLADKLDRLAGCNVSMERPGLTQISVAVMKHFSRVTKG
ncbi:MAG: ABC transporter ATP-binding protein [Acetatifactor sp.]|nr:ABC transporter ATP-binding protein [Acetatifactor sp.]MDE7044383.1 ABC transporter ATP-binding protein [Acetatifactor sp.]